MSKVESVALTRTDRTALVLDAVDSGHGIKNVVPVAMLTGLGVGVGTYHVVKENVFPANDEYEELKAIIAKSESEIAELQAAKDTLSGRGIEGSLTQINGEIVTYESVIAKSKDALPGDYNPHVEGLVTSGSALLFGSLAAYGLMRCVKSRADRARIKERSNNPSEQVGGGGGSEM